MSTAQRQRDWNARVTAFNLENTGRPTRLGVFEPSEAGSNDYWLESGLPLKGIAFEQHNGRLSAEIMLDGFTHVIENANRVELVYGSSHVNDGLNVVDSEGKTSVLRFESDRSEV